MKRKVVCVLISFLALFSFVACNKKEEVALTAIDIVKEGQTIDELNVLVGDTFTLDVVATPEASVEILWESSNPELVTISSSGSVDVKKAGTSVITATSVKYPYISDSIYIVSKRKVEQLGVGSGLTPEDPIFLGNEGEDEPIEVYFIEMQHIYADSIFIKKGNVEILIDAGYEYDGTFVNQLLMEKVADRRLDAFMVSHSDGDHIDGIAKALTGIDNISLMVDYGGAGGGNVLATRKKYIPLGTQYHSAYDCANHLNGASNRYYLTNEFYVDILNTGNYITPDKTSASNPSSLTVLFTYKDFKFFSGGDLTSESEKSLMRNENLPEVTLYKASHHGSHGSNSQELLNTLNPKAVAISAARADRYGVPPSGPQKCKDYNLNAASGHPAAAAIERIYKAPNISSSLNVYWNAVNGTMKFTSYGEDSVTFSGSPTMKGYYDLTLTNNVGVWSDTLNDYENKVTGEENKKLHETKVFEFRNYIQYLPTWAKEEYFPNYTA